MLNWIEGRNSMVDRDFDRGKQLNLWQPESRQMRGKMLGASLNTFRSWPSDLLPNRPTSYNTSSHELMNDIMLYRHFIPMTRSPSTSPISECMRLQGGILDINLNSLSTCFLSSCVLTHRHVLWLLFSSSTFTIIFKIHP